MPFGTLASRRPVVKQDLAVEDAGAPSDRRAIGALQRRTRSRCRLAAAVVRTAGTSR
jgi:hypothetical protein